MDGSALALLYLGRAAQDGWDCEAKGVRLGVGCRQIFVISNFVDEPPSWEDWNFNMTIDEFEAPFLLVGHEFGCA